MQRYKTFSDIHTRPFEEKKTASAEVKERLVNLLKELEAEGYDPEILAGAPVSAGIEYARHRTADPWKLISYGKFLKDEGQFFEGVIRNVIAQREKPDQKVVERQELPEGWEWGEPDNAADKADFKTVRDDISRRIQAHAQMGIDETLACEAATHAIFGWVAYGSDIVDAYYFWTWARGAVEDYMRGAWRSLPDDARNISARLTIAKEI